MIEASLVQDLAPKRNYGLAATMIEASMVQDLAPKR
jgi:hypothetical protein